jgi:hypothetical protein
MRFLAIPALLLFLSPAFAQSVTTDGARLGTAMAEEPARPVSGTMIARAEPPALEVTSDSGSAIPANWDDAVRNLPRVATHEPTALGRPAPDGLTPDGLALDSPTPDGPNPNGMAPAP